MGPCNAARRRHIEWFDAADVCALTDLARAYDAFGPEPRRASVVDPGSVRALLGAAARSGDFGAYEGALRRQARRCAEVGVGFEAIEGAYARLAGDIGSRLVRRYAHVPKRLIAVFDVLSRLMARELSVLAAEYGSAQTTAHAGDGVIATDERGVVVRMNPAAERMVGWTFAEAAGRSLGEVFRLEDHDTGEELAAVLGEGRVLGLPKHPTLIARNGSPACSVSESMAPIHAEDGSVRGAVLVFRDQRVEVARSEALEAGQAQMLAIIEASLDGLVTVDEDGRVRDLDPAAERMFGYDRDEIVGVPISDLLVPQGPGPTDPLVLGQRVERIARRADGSELPVEIATARIQAAGAAELICFVRDLTVGHQAEAAREDERTRIARELHDALGQHLTALRMDLGWLAHRQEDATPEVVERIAAMGGIVDATFATVRRIATELRPKILDDLGLVAAMTWQARELERRSGVRVEVDADADLPSIEPRTATALFRMFQEILTNVARHSGARTVRAHVAEQDGILRFEVTDDGRGIREEEAENVESLGLLGMRERATLLGGTFQIGAWEGGGTRVVVTLPNRSRRTAS